MEDDPFAHVRVKLEFEEHADSVPPPASEDRKGEIGTFYRHRNPQIPYVWYDPPLPRMNCLSIPEPAAGRYTAKPPGSRVYVPVARELFENAHECQKELFQSWILTNIVCTARLSCQWPIESIAWPLCGTYIRTVFPSCTGASLTPSASWTLFRQGYIRCAGGQTREWAQELITLIQFRCFIELRMPFRVYNFSVQNIVSAATYGKLSLEQLVRYDPTEFKYEGDVFPGMIHRMSNPRVVMQLFDSGKTNIVGAKRITQALRALLKIELILRQCRMLTFHIPEEDRNGHSLDTLQDRDVGPVNRFGEPLDPAPPATRHPQVTKAQKFWWRNKKQEKQHKETHKRRRNEKKALNDRLQELERQRNKRFKSLKSKGLISDPAPIPLLLHDDSSTSPNTNTCTALVVSSEGTSLSSESPTVAHERFDLALVDNRGEDELSSLDGQIQSVRRTLALLPPDGDVDEVSKAAVLEYEWTTADEYPQRTFRFEIQYDFTVNVHDAENDHELDRARVALAQLLY